MPLSKKKLVFLVLAIMQFYSIHLIGQATWNLEKEEDGIEVYTRKTDQSKIKQLKIICLMEAEVSEIMAALEDVEQHPNWVYKCKASEKISYNQNGSMNYRVLMDFPFPLKDRDCIIEYSKEQDRNTKVVTTKSREISGLINEYDDIVRIEHFKSYYKLVPIEEGQTKLEYFLDTDPGGVLPAWLINLAIAKGPTETIKSLIELIDSGRYKNAKVEGIVNLK